MVSAVRLRVLVVGTGWMGALHARTVSESRMADLCGVVDHDERVVRDVGARLEVPAFTDLEEAIDRTRPGAVIVATPDSTHRETTEAVIGHRIPVLVEKPLATNVADAEAIADLAAQSGTCLMTGHILRFDPRYAQVADAVHNGDVGRPVVFVANRWSRASLGARVADVTSPLWYFLIHAIDAVQWVSGGLIDRIDGATRTSSPAGCSAITVTGNLTTGAGVLLAAGWTLPDGVAYAPSASFEVHGELQHARIVDMDHGLTMSNEVGTRGVDSIAWPALYGRVDGSLRREVEHFVTAVMDETEFVITPGEAVAAVRSAAAIEVVSDLRSVDDRTVLEH